jgi:calcium binding protein 39
MGMLDFDARKDVAVLFTSLLRRQIGNRSPTVDYLIKKQLIFDQLIVGNGNPDIALNVGTILRDCVKYEPLAKLILDLPSLWCFFDYVNDSPFEISTDAFQTLNDLLSSHSSVVGQFLQANSAQFTVKINALMSSENYVTKRQSLKLMAHLLRSRSNSAYMKEYINDVANLKLVMILLRDKSKNIQYEAFHIFKIFVANPKKPKPILDILAKNKVKLLNFLPMFHSDRKDDKDFNEEKAFIIKQIDNLPITSPSASNSALPSTNTSPHLQPTLSHPHLPPPSSFQLTGSGPIPMLAPAVSPPVVQASPVHRGDHSALDATDAVKSHHPLPPRPSP